jgi:hypothetical protein
LLGWLMRHCFSFGSVLSWFSIVHTNIRRLSLSDINLSLPSFHK